MGPQEQASPASSSATGNVDEGTGGSEQGRTGGRGARRMDPVRRTEEVQVMRWGTWSKGPGGPSDAHGVSFPYYFLTKEKYKTIFKTTLN